MNKSGEVKFITGVVIATDANGSRRILKIGDEVTAAELLETSEAGSISIEFANGAVLDLGRNASTSYEIESENPLFEPVDEVVSESEAVVIEQSLLSGDETFDPTNPENSLEAPGAGSVAIGELDDDGSTIVQNAYAEPRITPDNGFETKPIAGQFPEQPSLELIQNPVQEAAIGGDSTIISPVAPPLPPDVSTLAPVSPLLPEVDIFSFNETQVDPAPEISAGTEKLFALRVDPVGVDMITKIVIDFPDIDGNSATQEWSIPGFSLFDFSPGYDVVYEDFSYQNASNTWQLTVDVISATAGEEIEFFLTLGASGLIPSQTIPLDVTYANGAGLFSPSSTVTFDVDNTAPAANFA